jgi:hypothetical protein
MGAGAGSTNTDANNWSHVDQVRTWEDYETSLPPSPGSASIEEQTTSVTDLQGPPLERTQTEKLQDLKKLAQHYAPDRGSCDDVQLSYLETLENRNNNNLRLAQMVAG